MKGVKSQIYNIISAGIIYLAIKYYRLPYFKYFSILCVAGPISFSALGLIEVIILYISL
jgi:hypothetical protein